MSYLEIPLFDDDFYKMVFRFGINLFFLVIIIRFLYYKHSPRREYLFTYFMIGIIVFFLCFALKKFQLDIGMALGLFAIFGIIRYRTDAIEIKEMTYLFVVIGVSVINSLANKKLSYAELLTANTIIVGSVYILEQIRALKNELSKKIVYEKIENIKPENYSELKQDLENRTGIAINRIKVNNIDFLKDTAQVIIYYDEDKESD